MLVNLHKFFTEYILYPSLSKLGYNGFFNQLLLAYSLMLCSTEMKKYEDYLTDTVNTGPRILMLPEHQVLLSSPLLYSSNFLETIPYNKTTPFCGASKGKGCKAYRNALL